MSTIAGVRRGGMRLQRLAVEQLQHQGGLGHLAEQRPVDLQLDRAAQAGVADELADLVLGLELLDEPLVLVRLAA